MIFVARGGGAAAGERVVGASACPPVSLSPLGPLASREAPLPFGGWLALIACFTLACLAPPRAL